MTNLFSIFEIRWLTFGIIEASRTHPTMSYKTTFPLPCGRQRSGRRELIAQTTYIHKRATCEVSVVTDGKARFRKGATVELAWQTG